MYCSPKMLSGRALLAVAMAMATSQAALAEAPVFQNSPNAAAFDPTRIVGGTDVADGENPFVVTLYDADGDQQCGASVLAPTLLMTAAHCVEVIEGGKAVVGRADLKDLTRGSEHRFTSIFTHPKFGKPIQYANDVAFVELATPILGVEPVDLAPLQKVDALKGLPVTVAGWGALGEGERGPSRMQEVEVDVLPSAECRKAYKERYDSASMFCAARPKKDSCQGDSGGPIFIKPLDGSTPIQVGVVSWGYGCARPESPGVYTRLDSASLWTGLGRSPEARRIRALLGR